MITIKDIAKMANCSVMTVSRVLNDYKYVNEDLRKRVQEVIKSSGYVQNNVARSLVQGCTHTICLYIPSELNSSETFVAQTLSAISEKLGNCGYSIMLQRQIPHAQNFDGLIAVGLNIDDEEKFMRFSSLKPSVLYGNSDAFSEWVDVDNFMGMYKITKMVIEKGRKNIAYVGFSYNARYVVQRKEGFIKAMQDSGFDINEDMMLATDNTEADGFSACETLMNMENPPDAIVFASDLIAVGGVHALNRRKISIPKQVAVTGFDGFGLENMVFPKLTTVKQPLAKVGEQLAEAIMDMIIGIKLKKGIYIEPTIVEGESL